MPRLTHAPATHAWAGILSLLAGCLITAALAPWDLWPAALLGCALHLALLRSCPPRAALWRGWLFGAGLFGSGASWIYVSIHDYGYASAPLAAALTALLCAALGLLYAAPAWLYARFFRHRPGGALAAFPALWVLFEWLRSWLLTGFPWLYLGYAALDTWAEGWAPVTGVFGISMLFAFSGSCLYLLCDALLRWRCLGNMRVPLACSIAVAALWLIGAQLRHIEWTAPTGAEPLGIAIIQPDIPQAVKWNRRAYDGILNRYAAMTEPLLGEELILWPEAAIPNYYQQAQDFLAPLAARAAGQGSALVTGIPWRPLGGREYFNSIVALGAGRGVYHKQRLVPFGEYLPLDAWLRGITDLFGLPMSAFSPGPPGQAPLQVRGLRLAPFICYEIVYPELVRAAARRADIMLTISNDSWFGASIGPLQHLQMARMRALENGRYLLRGTNNGVSAVIAPNGRIAAQAPRFQPATLSASAPPMQGQTPFARLGSTPPLILCTLLLALPLALRRFSRGGGLDRRGRDGA